MNAFSLAWLVLLSLLSLVGLARLAQLVVTVSGLRDRLARCEVSPNASLTSRLDELESAVEVVANRVKMQRVRAAALHATSKSDRSTELPDPYREPDAWRSAVNSQLARGKLDR
jgi:hypothetical protein